MKRRKIVLAFCFMMGPSLAMASVGNVEASSEVVYDCTAEETAVFIRKAAFNTMAPSPITTPGEFTKAYVEKKQKEEGDEVGCLSIFTDGSLNDQWEATVKQIRELDLGLPVTDFSMEAAAKAVKKAIDEQVAKALEKLREDVCAFMTTDNFKSIALDAVNAKYGLSLKEATLSDFKGKMEDMALDEIDDPRLKALLSADDMEKEIKSQSRKDVKKLRKEMWKGF